MKFVSATAALLLSSIACSSGESSPVTGDDQNFTQSQWSITSIGSGPDPFDVLGSYRVTAARASDGTLFAAFIDKDKHLAIATRTGSAWKAEAVTSGGHNGRFASIAVDGANTTHIVHYDETANALVYTTRAAGTTQWTHATLLARAAENRLVMTADGTLHLLAVEVRDGAMHYGTRTAGGAWKLERVGTGLNYDSPALSIDERGAPHASAWQWDAPGEGGKLVIADRTSGWRVEPVGLTTSYSSDLVVVNGVTHLAYASLSNGVRSGPLYYTSRTEGGAWSTPEQANWAGWSPDLALDSSGRPVVVASVEGYLQQASRSDSGEWTRSSISSAQGNIEPFFIAGSNEVVFTNTWNRSFSIAAPRIGQ